MNRNVRQREVFQWVRETFGDPSTVASERIKRVLEEAVELAQAEGMTRDHARAIVDYVFSKPKGRPGAGGRRPRGHAARLLRVARHVGRPGGGVRVPARAGRRPGALPRETQQEGGGGYRGVRSRTGDRPMTRPVGLTRAEEEHEQQQPEVRVVVKAEPGARACRIGKAVSGVDCVAAATCRVVWTDGDRTDACARLRAPRAAPGGEHPRRRPRRAAHMTDREKTCSSSTAPAGTSSKPASPRSSPYSTRRPSWWRPTTPRSKPAVRTRRRRTSGTNRRGTDSDRS